jgi:hypothetical protein
MGWREKSRAAAQNVRNLEVERQSVRESGALLKSEMTEIAARMKQSGEEQKRIVQLWSVIESSSESARVEYSSLAHEIRDLRKQRFDLMTHRDDEFHEVTMAILAEPKTRYSQRLTLTVQINEILTSKLVEDMPRCRDIAALVEQAVHRMGDLVESESRRGNL